MSFVSSTSRSPATRWPIFVISLADAHERRHRLEAQCAELDLAIEIIDAIDGRAGLPTECEAEIDRDATQRRLGRQVTDAEFACALSHRRIYERVAHHDLPGAVILEDDVIISPSFADFVKGRGYTAADFIQIDYSAARIFQRQVRQWSERIELAPLAENTHFTSGYSISARGARYVLSQTTPLCGLADWPCDMIPLGPLVTLPRLVTQSATDSHLAMERDALLEKQKAAAGFRWHRFFRRDYWRRWWMKRRTRRIS